jgi:hypothetical protein
LFSFVGFIWSVSNSSSSAIKKIQLQLWLQQQRKKKSSSGSVSGREGKQSSYGSDSGQCEKIQLWLRQSWGKNPAPFAFTLFKF